MISVLEPTRSTASFEDELISPVPRAKSYARHLYRDTSDAEDLTQAALARAISTDTLTMNTHPRSDPRESAAEADLSYVNPGQPGFSRHRSGRGFFYRDVGGQRVTDKAALGRIKALAIPPAWTRVWICPSPSGHLQAIGLDQKGRRQYRYHSGFRDLRESAKFDHVLTFAEALPILRQRVRSDMAAGGLGREKVIATVIYLLEKTMIRVGNAAYARDNKSFGLTTLRNRHLAVEGTGLKFRFKGKSGRTWRLSLKDRRVAGIIRKCQDLPGQNLFQYLGDDDAVHSVSSTDVNNYLKTAGGGDISAKDFRTWAATCLTALLLSTADAQNGPERKRALAAVIRQVAARLGNTPAICLKSYAHPTIVEAFLAGELDLGQPVDVVSFEDLQLDAMPDEEKAVFTFLSARLNANATPSVAT